MLKGKKIQKDEPAKTKKKQHNFDCNDFFVALLCRNLGLQMEYLRLKKMLARVRTFLDGK